MYIKKISKKKKKCIFFFILGQPHLPGDGFVLSIHVNWKEDIIPKLSVN